MQAKTYETCSCMSLPCLPVPMFPTASYTRCQYANGDVLFLVLFVIVVIRFVTVPRPNTAPTSASPIPHVAPHTLDRKKDCQ